MSLFFMNETDLKYLLATYQTTSSELFSQSVVTSAKIRQLTDLVNSLNEKVQQQEKQIEKLSKPKTTRSSKAAKDAGSF